MERPRRQTLKLHLYDRIQAHSNCKKFFFKSVQAQLLSLCYRRGVFDSLHRLVHLSIKATQKLIAHSFVWSKINLDVWKWARACLNCQRVKIYCHTHSPVLFGSLLPQRFEKVYVDIVGPLPSFGKYIHLLTIINLFLRWGEDISLPAIDARTVTDAFVVQWMLCFGVSSKISCNQDPQLLYFGKNWQND